MSSMPADGEAAAAPQQTAGTNTELAPAQQRIRLKVAHGLDKNDYSPAWIQNESGLFPLSRQYQTHVTNHNGRNIRLSYFRNLSTIYIYPMENTPEAESFTRRTPMLFQPTTGFSAVTTNNTANPVLHGFGSSSTPTPAPGRPDLPDFDEQNAVVPAPAATSPTKRRINLRYDHKIDQAIYNPSWVQKESGIYPLGDQDKLVEVETGNGPMTISYHAATRSIFLSTVREDSDSSESDEFVVSPAPPKQLAAGYSFQSDSSPSKKRSRNEGSGRSRTPSTTPPDKRARIETDEDVIFDDLDITANPTDRDSPTLGEGVPNPVVRQTTAPVPTVSGYGVPPPILGSGNWELPVPRTLSGETLLEMEQSLLAWLAVVRQMRSNLLQQNDPQNPQNPQNPQ